MNNIKNKEIRNKECATPLQRTTLLISTKFHFLIVFSLAAMLSISFFQLEYTCESFPLPSMPSSGTYLLEFSFDVMSLS
jgi:hypothetical protein